MQAVLDVRDLLLYALRGEKASFATCSAAAARAVLQAMMRRERRHVGLLEARLRDTNSAIVGVPGERRAH